MLLSSPGSPIQSFLKMSDKVTGKNYKSIKITDLFQLTGHLKCVMLPDLKLLYFVSDHYRSV